MKLERRFPPHWIKVKNPKAPAVKRSLAEQAAQQAATKDQAKAAIESINGEMVEVCAREDLRPYYSKTSCKAEDTTLAQMADRSRITNDEKVAMNEARVEVKRINKEVEDAIRQYSPQVASSTIARREQANAELDKNNEDFYEGRITRGEYNKHRMEIFSKFKQDLTSSSGATLIPVKVQGGTYVVPVLINKTITLNFVIDSGASPVSVPADVVLTLVRSGTLQQSDFIGTKTYTLADGSTVPSATFRIRSLTVGNIVIENVTGSVANVKGDLLLGQSFLSRFKSWSIDNSKQALVLTQ